MTDREILRKLDESGVNFHAVYDDGYYIEKAGMTGCKYLIWDPVGQEFEKYMTIKDVIDSRYYLPIAEIYIESAFVSFVDYSLDSAEGIAEAAIVNEDLFIDAYSGVTKGLLYMLHSIDVDDIEFKPWKDLTQVILNS